MRIIERKEDMSPRGLLRLAQAPDGDIGITIVDEHGQIAGVEFCIPEFGGGQSPRTWEALVRLMEAMEQDAEEFGP